MPPLDHAYTYAYDMHSQLTDADISNIIGTGNWSADYSYHKNGDMSLRIIQSNPDIFTYTGNLMATLDGTNLHWDENGQLTAGASAETLSYNWDGKLRSAAKAGTTINLKYDPAGNRIYKNSSVAGSRRYIVDIVGDLPVILLELEGSTVKKKYVYANSQILSQYDSDTSSWYYYLHDRLGSVRQLIKYVSPNVDVVRLYTYEPFGKTLEEEGTLSNPFRFTGQLYDSEIDQYSLRARDYNPYISRFTSRDPAAGKFEEPLTLHKYLYCGNDPINLIDLSGLDYFDFNLTYTPVGLVQGAAAGSLGGPLGFASGVAEGGFGFTGGLITEAGIKHKGRTGSVIPYFGFAWSASPFPSVTAMATYSTQAIPTKAEGTTGWQIAATFSAPRLGGAYQIGRDLSTGSVFEERGLGGGSSYVPMSFSLFYVFGDYTYGDSDLDRAVMLGEMLSDEPSLLGLQLRNILIAGWLDQDVYQQVIQGGH